MQSENGRPPSLSESQSKLLLDGLRMALARPGEHRLLRAGKLDGLFPSRNGAEVATHALAEGLIQTRRTEERGKSIIEWVEITPLGVEFVHRHDSPKAILRELRDTLHLTRAGLPDWLIGFERQLAEFNRHMADQLGEVTERLDRLTDRVERALRRAEAEPPTLAEQTRQLIPWGVAALAYLDRRQEMGVASAPLPEVFQALRLEGWELTLTEFQDGMRRLADLRALTFREGEAEQMDRPEFALLHQGRMCYFVQR